MKFYKETPISEKPEKEDYYIISDNGKDFKGRAWYNSFKNKFQWHEYNDGSTVFVTHYLRPVELHDVPSDSDIENHIESLPQSEFEKFENNTIQTITVGAAIWMRDTMLPTIAVLKDEIETMKRKESWMMEDLKKENLSLLDSLLIFNNKLSMYQEQFPEKIKIMWNEIIEYLINAHEQLRK